LCEDHRTVRREVARAAEVHSAALTMSANPGVRWGVPHVPAPARPHGKYRTPAPAPPFLDMDMLLKTPHGLAVPDRSGNDVGFHVLRKAAHPSIISAAPNPILAL